MFIVLGIGAFFSLLFHILIREGNATHLPLVNEDDGGHMAVARLMTWKDWLKEPQVRTFTFFLTFLLNPNFFLENC